MLKKTRAPRLWVQTCPRPPSRRPDNMKSVSGDFFVVPVACRTIEKTSAIPVGFDLLEEKKKIVVPFKRYAYYRNCRGLLIGCLLMYFNPIKSNLIDKTHAYVFASGLILSMMATVVIGRYVHMGMEHCGMKMRIACCSVIYKKVRRDQYLQWKTKCVSTVAPERFLGTPPPRARSERNHF